MSTTGDPIPGQNPEYSPFHPDLDQTHPVDTINFDSASKDLIIGGKVTPLQWCSIFRNSPANNMEAETLMGTILTDTIRAGQWVDIPEPLEDGRIEGFTATAPNGTRITIPGIPLEYRRAVDILEKVGFVARSQNNEGKRFIRPTEKLVGFVQKRVGFRRPPTQVPPSA